MTSKFSFLNSRASLFLDTGDDLPFELEAKADDPITDLATGVRKSLSTDLGRDTNETLDPDNSSGLAAVVLFSDGLHNDGESPLHAAASRCP